MSRIIAPIGWSFTLSIQLLEIFSKHEYATLLAQCLCYRSECFLILYAGLVRIGNIANAFNSQWVMTFLAVVGFITTGGTLTTKRVFTTISLVAQVRVSCLIFGLRCAFLITEASVAIKRIQVACVFMTNGVCVFVVVMPSSVEPVIPNFVLIWQP